MPRDQRMPHEKHFEREAAGGHVVNSPQRMEAQAIVWLLRLVRKQGELLRRVAQGEIVLQEEIDDLSSPVLVHVSALFSSEETEMAVATLITVALMATLSDGTTRPLTDADGVKVAVDTTSGWTYTPIDASNGELSGGTAGQSGSLSFTASDGSSLGSAGYTWPSDGGGGGGGGTGATITGVEATFTPKAPSG